MWGSSSARAPDRKTTVWKGDYFIDMNSGDHLWMIANANTPDNIKNHRLLEGIDIPRTGIPTRAGVLLTKELLFAEGAGGVGASPIFTGL